MSESKAKQCEFNLIKSWISASKPFLKASVKSITDLKVDGFPAYYSVNAIAKHNDDEHVVHIMDHKQNEKYIYRLNLKNNRAFATGEDTLTRSLISKNGIVLATKYDEDGSAVLIDGEKKANINVSVISEECKNGWCTANRFIQHRGDDIYYRDVYDRLHTLKWSDIEAGNYSPEQVVVANNVQDFSMSQDGVGVLNTNGKLKLPSGISFNLNSVSAEAKWTNLDKVANHWIATGGLNDTAILASVGPRGHFRSSLELQLTRNRYKTASHPRIYCLRPAFERRGRAVILAIERDGVCHLVGMTARGRLATVTRLSNMADRGREYAMPNYEVVLCVSDDGVEGEFVLGGYCWMKKLALKLN